MKGETNPMINLVDSFSKPKTPTMTAPTETETVDVVKSKELITPFAPTTSSYVGEKPKREERM